MNKTGVVKCPYCERNMIVACDDENGFTVGDMYAGYVSKEISKANDIFHKKICNLSSSNWNEIGKATIELQERIKSIKTREEWLKGE